MTTILYPPTLDWDWMPQRPQQILGRLPERGFRVIYCNETQRPGAPLEEVRPGLLLCRDFAALRRQPLEDVVVYATWGCHHPLFGHWGARLNVFDNVDDIEAWEDCDREAARRADLMLAASEVLRERWRPLRQDVHLVPNGCDADHFGQARRGTVPPPPPDLAGVPRPAAGYVGALAPWVDGDLVAALARRYPDWSFVFIGAPFGWSPPDLPNCFRMGLKPYEELPRYLAHLDVLLIPYRADRVTLAASPAKFFEYAATGRPIVATALPALRPFAHAAFLAESPAAFLELLPAALADRDPAREAARLAVARDNTWDERADRVARILTDALTRRGGWGRG